MSDTDVTFVSMKSIFLNKNISRRVELGHPWIFGNEVNTGKALDAAAKPGEVVNVYTYDKKFIGSLAIFLVMKVRLEVFLVVEMADVAQAAEDLEVHVAVTLGLK